MIYTTLYHSPIEAITLAATDYYLIGLWFEGQKHFGTTIDSLAVESDNHPILKLGIEWLDRYFAGEIPPSTPPLELRGTPFQKRVWQELLSIPHGECCTYKDLAFRIGSTKGFQAVGNAVSRNPISIIVPCHRVLATNGSLTGYAGGLDRKEKLLQIEKLSYGWSKIESAQHTRSM